MMYNGPSPVYALYLIFLLPLFSAWRLAKFNIDPRQSESFIGVPTPANAIFWGSLPLIAIHQPAYSIWLDVPYILPAIFVFCILMVSELPLFSLKFKSLAFAKNQVRYLFLIGAIVLIAILGYAGIPLSIIWYVLLSAGVWVRQKVNG
jgi:CDP-diacylglycerol---serine O-phosphatidyltransferase